MSGYRFLIDVNLPKHFSFFNSEVFEFVIDINGKWPDRDIWEYARENQLVIVTKDTDFYHRCLLDPNPVKVIHIKLGNVLIRDMHLFFQKHWQTIIEYLPNARMVIATLDRLEVIPV